MSVKTKKKRAGNPARAAWDPLAIIDSRDPGTHLGMAGCFHRYGGRKHWYQYRSPQPATACKEFRNRLYNGFVLVFEDGSMHLSFKRNDRAPVRDWRHVQAIKNEVAGPEREAFEVYPAESMLVDAANEYHLWVLPEDAMLPLGIAERAVHDLGDTHDHALYRQTGKSGARQRSWEPGIPTGLGIINGEGK
jgi:hypothetical protein